LDEFADELVLQGTDFVEDESKRSATDQIKEATKFDPVVGPGQVQFPVFLEAGG
jgi:hypothetical protein